MCRKIGLMSYTWVALGCLGGGAWECRASASAELCLYPCCSKPSVLEGHQERSFPILVSMAGRGDSFVQAPRASTGDPGHLLKLICLILGSGAARHLPAHLPDTRQLSRGTPACSSAMKDSK